MSVIPQFEVGGSHREVGLAIGRRFADRIHRFFDHYDFLRERLLPFHRSPAGQRFYQPFLDLHEKRFPGYVAEMRGLAEGAGRPFEEVFLVNMRGEYGGLIERARPSGKGCTDCLLLTPEAALMGHTEDGSPAALGNVFVVHARVDDRPTFTALCYPGFVPGNAFGFNEAGVMHTINAVSPRPVQVGVARQFIARSLLDARSLDEAVRRTEIPGRAAGFTYNIGSLPERRIVSVEVSPERHHLQMVRDFYGHTNHYLHLQDVTQEIGPSSRARLARVRALCQGTPSAPREHLLALLGDEADPEYPIYRRAVPPDRGATLCSALFDLDARRLHIYAGHPTREPERCITLDL